MMCLQQRHDQKISPLQDRVFLFHLDLMEHFCSTAGMLLKIFVLEMLAFNLFICVFSLALA